MVLRRQLTPFVVPPTAPRAKNLRKIIQKSISNQYKMPSGVEKTKKDLHDYFCRCFFEIYAIFVSFDFADFFFNTVSCLNIKKTLF